MKPLNLILPLLVGGLASTATLAEPSNACFKNFCVGQTIEEVVHNSLIRANYDGMIAKYSTVDSKNLLTESKLRGLLSKNPVCRLSESKEGGVIPFEPGNYVVLGLDARANSSTGTQWIVTSVEYSAEVNYTQLEKDRFQQQVITQLGAIVPTDKRRLKTLRVRFMDNPYGTVLSFQHPHNRVSARVDIAWNEMKPAFQAEFSEERLVDQAGCPRKEKLSF